MCFFDFLRVGERMLALGMAREHRKRESLLAEIDEEKKNEIVDDGEEERCDDER